MLVTAAVRRTAAVWLGDLNVGDSSRPADGKSRALTRYMDASGFCLNLVEVPI